MKVYEDERTMSRTDLARWLHELANTLESGGELAFGEEAAGRVAMADEVLRELEIQHNEDGSKTKVEIEIEWTGAGSVPHVGALPEPGTPEADGVAF